MTKNPFVNSFSALLYIVIVASVMFYGVNHKESVNSVIVPITMLSVFTLSAAVMGYIFLYHPLIFYLDGKKKEAINLFLKTLGSFAIITVVALALLFSGKL